MRCIWCKRTDEETEFKNQAHTIPESLGGEEICQEVCDDCNHHFGSNQNRLPGIEIILKEALYPSKIKLTHGLDEIGRNKTLARPKSTLFDINIQKRQIKTKLKYWFTHHLDEKIGRLFKRGIYKIFLEENQRLNGNSLDPQFDFIREFARYDLGDYPVFYFSKKVPVYFTTVEDVLKPKIHFQGHFNYIYSDNDYGYFEFEMLGHVFGITTLRTFEITQNVYLNKSMEMKTNFFSGYLDLKTIKDIDIFLDYIN